MREMPVCQAEKAKAVAKMAEKPTAAHAPKPTLLQSKLMRYGEESSMTTSPPKSREYVATASGEWRSSTGIEPKSSPHTGAVAKMRPVLAALVKLTPKVKAV